MIVSISRMSVGSCKSNLHLNTFPVLIHGALNPGENEMEQGSNLSSVEEMGDLNITFGHHLTHNVTSYILT